MKEERIGVFGGSFNPVHNGHIAVARAAVKSGAVDRVLMVMSPLNPLKSRPDELLDDTLRLEMLRLGCAPHPELEASDIELTMPRPSYTIDTLRRLQLEHPRATLRLIIGADNWDCFCQWRSWEDILAEFPPLVYPREGYPLPGEGSTATVLDAPLEDISSTEIRERLIKGEPVNNLLPPLVLEYITLHQLYRRENPDISNLDK